MSTHKQREKERWTDRQTDQRVFFKKKRKKETQVSQTSSWVHCVCHMAAVAAAPFGFAFEHFLDLEWLVQDCLKSLLAFVCTLFCLGLDNRQQWKTLQLWKGESKALSFSVFSYGRHLNQCICWWSQPMILGFQASNAPCTKNFSLSFPYI